MADRARDRDWGTGLSVAGLMLALFPVALDQTVAGAVIRPLAARGTGETR